MRRPSGDRLVVAGRASGLAVVRRRVAVFDPEVVVVLGLGEPGIADALWLNGTRCLAVSLPAGPRQAAVAGRLLGERLCRRHRRVAFVGAGSPPVTDPRVRRLVGVGLAADDAAGPGADWWADAVPGSAPWAAARAAAGHPLVLLPSGVAVSAWASPALEGVS